MQRSARNDPRQPPQCYVLCAGWFSPPRRSVSLSPAPMIPRRPRRPFSPLTPTPRPELLMYEPKPNESLQLIGVDYVVPLDVSAKPPRLLGVPFMRNEPLDEPESELQVRSIGDSRAGLRSHVRSQLRSRPFIGPWLRTARRPRPQSLFVKRWRPPPRQ